MYEQYFCNLLYYSDVRVEKYQGVGYAHDHI